MKNIETTSREVLNNVKSNDIITKIDNDRNNGKNIEIFQPTMNNISEFKDNKQSREIYK